MLPFNSGSAAMSAEDVFDYTSNEATAFSAYPHAAIVSLFAEAAFGAVSLCNAVVIFIPYFSS
jgi:hypothetical protein